MRQGPHWRLEPPELSGDSDVIGGAGGRCEQQGNWLASVRPSEQWAWHLNFSQNLVRRKAQPIGQMLRRSGSVCHQNGGTCNPAAGHWTCIDYIFVTITEGAPFIECLALRLPPDVQFQRIPVNRITCAGGTVSPIAQWRAAATPLVYCTCSKTRSPPLECAH